MSIEMKIMFLWPLDRYLHQVSFNISLKVKPILRIIQEVSMKVLFVLFFKVGLVIFVYIQELIYKLNWIFCIPGTGSLIAVFGQKFLGYVC